MDGEYDIMGNPIGGAAAAHATAPAPAGESSESAGGALYKEGDKCEVKEGGSKYRAATVVKFDEGIGAVDVTYSDGEKECGIPVNLVRKAGAGGGAASTTKPKQPPVAQQRPVDYVEEANAPPPRRRNKGSKELARQCYELVKSFSEEEQQAALQMLQALDSVRASTASEQ